MALTEETVSDRIEILENGVLQVREAVVIKRDGVEIARTFTRKIIDVEDDTSAEDQRIKDVAAAVWTPAVKAARAAERAAQQAQLPA